MRSDNNITSDEVNDEFNLIIHRLIAREIRRNPSLRQRASLIIEDYFQQNPDVDYVQQWRTVLNAPGDNIKALCSRSQNSYWLRISSPFPTISSLPLSERTFRKKVWGIAKKLLALRKSKGREW